MKRILFIDDDADAQILVSATFKNDYQVLFAKTVEEAKQIILNPSIHVDLFIIDLGLPDGLGHEVSQLIRSHQRYSNHPIIILSAKKDTVEHIRGYQTGADNYLEKPFSKDELKALVRNKIERQFTNQTKISCKDLLIDLSTSKVLINNEEINLTPIEFKILTLLAQKQNQLTLRSEIFNSVWGDDGISDRSIDHHILSIRRKIKKSQVVIEGIYGKGYKLLYLNGDKF